jgi:PsbN protein
MEFSALFSAVFIACLLLSITGYAIYTSFGPAATDLRDPFEEHED